MPVITPVELVGRLRQLGIERTERALRSWRQKGLLPQLQQHTLGRGKGSVQVWEEDVLDQAIATHGLLTQYAKADEALLGLWLSGYEVSTRSAHKAWIGHLERVRDHRQQAASDFEDGYLQLGASWWRRLPESQRRLAWTRDFIIETTEWLHDRSERDDEAYRMLVVEFIGMYREGTLVPAKKDTYQFVDTVWEVIQPLRLFGMNESIQFVHSLSVSDLDRAHQSLAAIRRMIQHGSKLFGESHVFSIHMTTRLMQDIGSVTAKLLISLNRKFPELPFGETIQELHDFVMHISPAGLSWEKDGNCQANPTVRNQWETVKQDLQLSWATAAKTLTNRLGHPDPTSG